MAAARPEPAPRARSVAVAAVWALALVLGFALRAAPLTAARPYMTYVDEGNYLQTVIWILRRGGWSTHFYLYPQFPTLAVAAAVRGLDPFYRTVHRRSMLSRIPAQSATYDELEPFPILFIARSFSLAAGLASAVLAGLLARRLAGPIAGAAAALLTALVPALVLRGSIAMVDSYATVFALACVSLADVARTAARPGLASLGAGVMAGFAFASKYPAVLVVIAFGVTVLLQPATAREKLRRLNLGAAGLVLGVGIAMPAALFHPDEVWKALQLQTGFYQDFASPPLWRQALVRVEFDLPYEGPELGIGLTALALGGLFVALRDRKTRPAAAGWVAFAGAMLCLFAIRRFQPFRNLLPLVPLVCILAGIFFVRMTQSLRNPRLVNALALLWVLATFGWPLARWARERHALADTRTQAVDWLVAKARPGDRVLVVRDLGVLGQELARLPPPATGVFWEELEAEIAARQPRFVVAGVLNRMDGSRIDVAAVPAIASAYGVAFRAGEKPTAAMRTWWRGNDQIVTVLERR